MSKNDLRFRNYVNISNAISRISVSAFNNNDVHLKAVCEVLNALLKEMFYEKESVT